MLLRKIIGLLMLYGSLNIGDYLLVKKDILVYRKTIVRDLGYPILVPHFFVAFFHNAQILVVHT